MGGDEQLTLAEDGELIARVRDGDPDAYGELYGRHAAAARRFAQSLVATRADADDVVAEVFASLLATLRRGGGPTELFLPYLLTSIRNECRRVNRRGSREAVDRHERVDHLIDARCALPDPAADHAEAAVIAAALTTLPPSLREILWRTEVAEEPARAIAAERGATPHAVAEAALRARRALGSAYLQLHVGGGASAGAELDADCSATRPYLAAYVRRGVGVRRRRHIDRHLLTCASCAAAHDSLRHVNRRLRARPVVPVEAGGLGIASWGVKSQVLAWLSSTAAPIAASGAVVAAVLAPPHHERFDRPARAPLSVVVVPAPPPVVPPVPVLVVQPGATPPTSTVEPLPAAAVPATDPAVVGAVPAPTATEPTAPPAPAPVADMSAAPAAGLAAPARATASTPSVPSTSNVPPAPPVPAEPAASDPAATPPVVTEPPAPVEDAPDPRRGGPHEDGAGNGNGTGAANGVGNGAPNGDGMANGNGSAIGTGPGSANGPVNGTGGGSENGAARGGDPPGRALGHGAAPTRGPVDSGPPDG